MISSFRVPLENAQTGEPMQATGAVSRQSIVLRIGDTVYVATRQALSLDETEDLRAQLDEVLR